MACDINWENKERGEGFDHAIVNIIGDMRERDAAWINDTQSNEHYRESPF
jgi:hypothetical protein